MSAESRIQDSESDVRKSAAERLFAHLLARHVRDDGALVGPDPGVSLNLRVTRFIKSYLRFMPWHDRLYYLQAQAYWILDNSSLYELTGNEANKDLAIRCAWVVASRQTPDGYWEYPQAEWRGRVATVEGCFGGLALLAGYGLCGEDGFLAGAQRWYECMIDRVGFQEYDGESIAVNYFSNVRRGMVPNNSTLALWFCAALSMAASDARYLKRCAGMMSFLARCQLDSGELPYVVGSEYGAGRVHYLCFQYNAFQFLDLAEYHALTNDEAALGVMRGLARFLSDGLTAHGDARHDCEADGPTMHYFTSAVAAALMKATALGLGDYTEAATRGWRRLLSKQREDGGFDYSVGDYGLLRDRRSYPRTQAMMLRHLLIGARA